MAVNFVYQASGSKIGDTASTTGIVFDGFDTVAGQLLVVGVRWEAGGASDSATISFSDTAGHTFATRIYKYATGSGEDTTIAVTYVLSTSAQTNNVITGTISAGRAYKEGVWARYSYTGTIERASTNASGGSSSDVTPHTMSPDLSGVSGDLIVGIFGRYNSGGWTVGTNFTERQDTGLTYLEDRILTGTAATTVTATPSGSDSWSGIGLLFQEEGAGGGGGTTKANLIKQVSRYHLGVGSLGRIQRRS